MILLPCGLVALWLCRTVRLLWISHSSVCHSLWPITPQLDKSTASVAHPYHKFGTGSYSTLWEKPQAAGIDTRAALLKFHETYYSANQMTLVVIGKCVLLGSLTFSCVASLMVGRPHQFSSCCRGCCAVVALRCWACAAHQRVLIVCAAGTHSINWKTGPGRSSLRFATLGVHHPPLRASLIPQRSWASSSGVCHCFAVILF